MSKVRRAMALARYHQPSQFAWRAYRQAESRIAGRFRRRYVFPVSGRGLRAGAKPLLRAMAARRESLWPERQDAASLQAMAAGRFRFLNDCRDLRTGRDRERLSIDWQPDAPRLWRFHLHYHESLLELASQVSIDAAWSLIGDWLREPRHQSPHADPDAWHPFCISQRVPQWLMLAARSDIPKDLGGAFWQSLAGQIDWLASHLEWDLGGNHLLENLRTLTIAEAVVEGDFRLPRQRLRRWTHRELQRQVLPTGEHFERTPTYHALMLLAVIEIAEAEEWADGVSSAGPIAARMAEFLEGIIHPDGQVPLFGDSVIGETPAPEVLCGAAPAGEANPQADEDYWVWRSRSGDDCLVFDTGAVACDHLPAHGHADLLGLEASISGRRFLVDTGTYDYEDSAARQRCRSTLSHNTVSIDGRDQCDVWSRFRMGDRGHVLWKRRGAHAQLRWCVAAHDAYRRLGVAETVRAVIIDESSYADALWMIIDWFEGEGRHQLSSRLQFAPEFQVGLESVSRETGDENVSVPEVYSVQCREALADASGDGHGGRRVRLLGEGKGLLCESIYHPDFGVSIRNAALVVAASLGPRQPLGWLIEAGGDGQAGDQRCYPRVCLNDAELVIEWGGAAAGRPGGDVWRIPVRE